MLTDTDHSRVRCSPIDSGMLKRPGTRSNILGPDPDPADHLKYRPEPVRVPGPRVSGPPWRPLLWSTWRDEAKTIKPITNEAFVASSGDIITDYNDLYCLFTRRKLEKRQTTSTTLHCSKLAFESSVAETYLQAASQKSDCPCKVGIAPLYRNSLCANLQARLLSCQVQEIVLRKLRRTRSNIWVELFWNSVVNTT